MKSKPSSLLYIILSLLFASISFGAEADETASTDLFELSLEELMAVTLVTTPSRIAESIDLAPNVIYRQESEDFKRRGLRTIGDLLDVTPGFFTNYRQQDLVAATRGIAPNGHNKITYMLNGHSINNLTETSLLNGPLLLDTIDSVEVVVGPGSVLYGSDTLAGSVNLKTKDTVGVKSQARLGTDMKAFSFVAGGYTKHDIYLKISGTVMALKGFDAWNDNNFPEFKGDEDLGSRMDSYNLMVESAWKAFRLQYFHYQSTQRESTIDQVAARAGSSVRNGERNDTIDSLVLKHIGEITDELEVTTKLSADFKSLDRIIANPPYFAGQSGYELNENIYGLEQVFRYEHGSHFLQAGMQGKMHDYPSNYRIATNAALTGVDKTTIVKDEATWEVGGFISDKWTINDRYTLVSAVRGDRSTLLKDSKVYISPRVAFIRENESGNWISKWMYNKSTRMPDAWMSSHNQIFGAGNPLAPTWASVNPNADRPETLTSFEWQNIYYPNRDFRLALNLYRQELKDFISWLRPFTNVGNMTSTGAELSASYRVNKTLKVNSWVSWADSKWELTATSASVVNFPMTTDGKSVSYPQWIAGMSVEYQPLDSLYITPTLRYFTEQPSKVAVSPNVFTGDDTVRNRYYFDTTIVYKNFLVKHLDLQLMGKNLLNERDVVAVQWGGGAQYHPRGRVLEAALYYEF